MLSFLYVISISYGKLFHASIYVNPSCFSSPRLCCFRSWETAVAAFYSHIAWGTDSLSRCRLYVHSKLKGRDGMILWPCLRAIRLLDLHQQIQPSFQLGLTGLLRALWYFLGKPEILTLILLCLTFNNIECLRLPRWLPEYPAWESPLGVTPFPLVSSFTSCRRDIEINQK